MKITLTNTCGHQFKKQVRAEPFEIEGSTEKFAVHKTRMNDVSIGYHLYSATHIASGLRVAHAGTEEECIAEARRIWASKTPEELETAIAKAMALKNNP